jgi:hypothetical protein
VGWLAVPPVVLAAAVSAAAGVVVLLVPSSLHGIQAPVKQAVTSHQHPHC